MRQRLGPAACAAEYDEGTELTVTATPGAGSSFAGFGGSGGSASACATSPCTFTITEETPLSAKFDQVKHKLLVEKSGNGKVLSAPSGISCGTTCEFSFVEGTSVTLTATPDAGNKFSGWNGCDSTAGEKCTVAMGAALKVSASFEPISTGGGGGGGGGGTGGTTTDPPTTNPPPPPPPVGQPGPCVAKANKAFNAAMKAAKKKKGKAKAKAVKAAKARKAKAIKACKAQFA